MEGRSLFLVWAQWHADDFRCCPVSAREITPGCSSVAGLAPCTCRFESTARLKWRSLP